MRECGEFNVRVTSNSVAATPTTAPARRSRCFKALCGLFRWGPIDLRGGPPEGLKWKLVYCTPCGEEVTPCPAELRRIIYEQRPEYYANSGGASLYGTAHDSRGVVIYSAHNTPHLCWFLEEPFGFHFSFDPPKRPRQLT
jgi:hypothetical protein